MPSYAGAAGSRRGRRDRRLRPSLLGLEPRVVLSIPGIAGVTFDPSGDVFVSYDSEPGSPGTEQAVAEFNANGQLVNSAVITSSGSPGDLIMVGSASTLLPGAPSSGDIVEVQPDGQLLVFNPATTSSPTAASLSAVTPSESSVFDIQTGSTVNLGGAISLTDATFGDFGVDGDALVISAESNKWDFVMRVTFGSEGPSATVLVASPASDGLTASPGGVAVGPQGTVLTTLPYLPAGASTAIHVAVGFSLFEDQGESPQPSILTLGLSTAPDIDSTGITVDAQENFILAASTSSLYGGGPGVVHINASLNAFLADPTSSTTTAIPAAITYQNVSGTDYLALTYPQDESYTIAGEIPLFSGQVSPAQLRQAYGVSQISFTTKEGATVAGTGTGQTIAIVEEGVDPTLEADLHTFDQFFGIADPPSFQVIDQNGVTTENDSIVGEASLDVEWAHAIAPGASIIVYNAAYEPDNATASFENLIEAMHEASLLPGVSVVSLSYGEPEPDVAESGLSETQLDANFTTAGVTFVAASGDSGIYGNGGYQIAVNYPAASPDVLSVGGTAIDIDAAGDYPGTGSSGEVGWGDGTSSGEDGGSGGGLSTIESEPAWQQSVVPATIDSSGARAVPDVAMDSGTAQEYDVFTSTLSGSTSSASAVGWLGDAGTSAAAPIWAGLIAIADQGRVAEGGTPLTGDTQTIPALYSLPSADFHDILSGNNGDPAGPGYDLVTGRGSPVANLLVPALASYGVATQIAVKATPASAVVGQAVTLRATVSEVSAGTGVPTGTVTFDVGSTSLGTVSLSAGVATLVTTPTAAGTETITVAYSGDSRDQPSSVTFPLTVSPAPAELGLSNLIVTYDGSPRAAAVITSPAGLSGVTVVYSQNGTVVANPTHAGTYTVTATLNNPNYTAQPATGDLVIGQASPTLTWADPAEITAGTALSTAQLDATASFDGASLAGVFVYGPAAGVVLPAGDDQTLTVRFQPTDAADFRTVTAAVTINVAPISTPTPTSTSPVVTGEQPIFERKTNARGTPVGARVLSGFSFEFAGAVNLAAAGSPASYEIDSYVIKKVKKTTKRVLRPITNFTVSYNAANDEATIHFTGKETFPSGGQITISTAVGGDAGVVAPVFNITDGGRRINPR